MLVIEYKQTNKDGSMKNAKLNLVDLAGSEKVGKTGASGSVLEEAKKINLSLSFLRNVIAALSKGEAHVPFRNSKLTHLLKESLGGNSKTSLICTVRRQYSHAEESLSSLKFAKGVKCIKNKANLNIVKSQKEMMMEIEKLKEQIHQLKLGGASGSNPKNSMGGSFLARDTRELLEENESLKSQLTALQNEFDYYKDQKQELIEELTDRLEKMDEIEQELRTY